MFFIGLTFSQMLVITGIVLLFLQSYVVGGPLLLAGAFASYVFVQFYQKRKKGRKKKKERDWDCWGVPDCIEIPLPRKLDCDCSPDCSN